MKIKLHRCLQFDGFLSAQSYGLERQGPFDDQVKQLGATALK